MNPNIQFETTMPAVHKPASPGSLHNNGLASRAPISVVHAAARADSLVAVHWRRESCPAQRTPMFVPQSGGEQLNDESSAGQIQPRFPCHLDINLEDIDQNAGRAVIRTLQSFIQIPNQIGVKLISVVFEQPGVTVWQLTGRRGLSH